MQSKEDGLAFCGPRDHSSMRTRAGGQIWGGKMLCPDVCHFPSPSPEPFASFCVAEARRSLVSVCSVRE